MIRVNRANLDLAIYDVTPIVDIATRSLGRALNGSILKPPEASAKKVDEEEDTTSPLAERDPYELTRDGFTYNLIRQRKILVKTTEEPAPVTQIRGVIRNRVLVCYFEC
jgi:hypothetical protein